MDLNCSAVCRKSVTFCLVTAESNKFFRNNDTNELKSRKITHVLCIYNDIPTKMTLFVYWQIETSLLTFS